MGEVRFSQDHIHSYIFWLWASAFSQVTLQNLRAANGGKNKQSADTVTIRLGCKSSRKL